MLDTIEELTMHMEALKQLVARNRAPSHDDVGSQEEDYYHEDDL